MLEKNNEKPLRIGVSQCLLGEHVRFDGGHKRDNYLMTILSQYAEFVTVCPEVEIGMGIPRPPIHQKGDVNDPIVVGVKDESLDVTKPLKKFSHDYVKNIDDLSAFILKSKSPTCGMERVKVFQGKRMALRTGVGIFARVLMDTYPYLPVEEEGRLHDPVIRENFITRIFAYQRFLQMSQENITPAKLIAFHTQHKLLLRSHNEAGYQRLGQLVANIKATPFKEIKTLYLHEFMRTLKVRSNNKKHANVLYHLLGYLKKQLLAIDKKELVEVIELYRNGQLPLIVPITLLKHHFKHHPSEYVSEQIYLSPHPAELMLRNHI